MHDNSGCHIFGRFTDANPSHAVSFRSNLAKRSRANAWDHPGHLVIVSADGDAYQPLLPPNFLQLLGPRCNRYIPRSCCHSLLRKLLSSIHPSFILLPLSFSATFPPPPCYPSSLPLSASPLSPPFPPPLSPPPHPVPTPLPPSPLLPPTHNSRLLLLGTFTLTSPPLHPPCDPSPSPPPSRSLFPSLSFPFSLVLSLSLSTKPSAAEASRRSAAAAWL